MNGPTTAAAPLLALKGVSFRYPGTASDSPPAVRDANLEIYPGDRVGVVGPNGGGKTTLVKLVLGLFRPNTGSIELLGEPANWSRHVPRVGYIGNPSRNDGESGLPLDLTVKQLLDTHEALFVRSGLPYPHAATLAARLDLDKPEWRSKRISELSDGWRQRVLAYLALVKQPALLIADEATAGLDPPHRKAVLDTIGDVLATTEMAVMWVTHDHNELLTLQLQKIIQVARGSLESMRVSGWHSEISVDSEEPRRLLLTPDALFKLFSELTLNPDIERIQLKMERGGNGEVTS